MKDVLSFRELHERIIRVFPLIRKDNLYRAPRMCDLKNIIINLGSLLSEVKLTIEKHNDTLNQLRGGLPFEPNNPLFTQKLSIYLELFE